MSEELPTEILEPVVEFGTGWAKVHFRRELTDEDRANILAAVSGARRPAEISAIAGCLNPSFCWKLPCPLDASEENMCRKPKCAAPGDAQGGCND